MKMICIVFTHLDENPSEIGSQRHRPNLDDKVPYFISLSPRLNFEALSLGVKTLPACLCHGQFGHQILKK